jgi:hypothetical protein
LSLSLLDFEYHLQKTKEMSQNKLFLKNIDLGLRTQLKETLPLNAFQLCNNNKLKIVVSKIRPWKQRKVLFISKFHNNEDIINAVAGSCYIPIYSNGQLYTKLNDNSELKRNNNNKDNTYTNEFITNNKNKLRIDYDSIDNNNDIVVDGCVLGGILPYYPRGVLEYNNKSEYVFDIINITPYPKKIFKLDRARGIPIEAPDINLELLPDYRKLYTPTNLLKWSFIPGNPTIIQQLYDNGQFACDIWINNNNKIKSKYLL